MLYIEKKSRIQKIVTAPAICESNHQKQSEKPTKEIKNNTLAQDSHLFSRTIVNQLLESSCILF